MDNRDQYNPNQPGTVQNPQEKEKTAPGKQNERQNQPGQGRGASGVQENNKKQW